MNPGSTSGMLLTVLLKQTNRFQYPVRLRLTIESQEVFIQTKSNYIPPPIFLDGGVPVTLTGADLAGYFNSRNLNITGSNAEAIRRGKPLPEGFYTFTVEVLDYNRGVTVSNQGRAMAWLMLNDPPFLNMPVNQSTVEQRQPQNLLFQWTPRHTGSPNAAFNVRYQFELVEIRPAGRNPNDAMLTTPPVYETEVFGNTLIYGPGEPQLIPGMQYAWRVRAIDNSGKDLFENNGYSEVYQFTYGEACKTPVNIFATPNSSSKVSISWNQEIAHDRYEVKFRKKSEQYTPWHTYATESDRVEVPYLMAETTYQYKVYGECFGNKSEPSALLEVTTPEVEEFACGDEIVPYEPVNQEPVDQLFYGSIIKAAKFEVFVTRAQRTGEGFTGTGLMTLPFLKSIRVPATFENIIVNTDYELIAGQVITTHAPAENVLNTDSLFTSDDTMGDMADEVGDATGADTVIVVDGDIDTLFLDGNGDIIVVTTDGDEINMGELGTDLDGDGEPDEAVAFVDEDGDAYVIDTGGNGGGNYVGNYGGGGNTDPSDYTPNGHENRFDFIVQFAEDPNDPHGGFDQKDFDAHQHYEQMTIKEDEYTIPWKSMVTGNSGRIQATYKPEGEARVVYKSGYGNRPIESSTTQDDIVTDQILLQGRMHGEVEQLYATGVDTTGGDYYEEALGRINLISYNAQSLDLTIVPVNDDQTNIGNLQQDLNAIFAQAGISIGSIHQLQSLSVPGWDKDGDNKFDDGDGNLFSPRSAEMNEVIRQLKNTYGRDKNTYYIFLIPETTKTPTRLGAMPRKTQYGFIFTRNLGSYDLSKVIAHELGHGAFTLEHPWQDNPALAEGTTQNLMDTHPTGTTLRKPQWDQIHDPELVIGLFEEEGESALDVDKQKLLLEALLNDFEEELSAWLEAKRNGEPVDTLSSCLTQNFVQMENTFQNILSQQEEIDQLLSSIQQTSEDFAMLDTLSYGMNYVETGLKEQFNDEDWNSLKDMVCGYILAPEVELPQLVFLDVPNRFDFHSGIDDDRLEIIYSFEKNEFYKISDARMEIYINDSTLVFIKNSIPTENGKLLWDGKITEGAYKGEYIRADNGPFKIVLSAFANQTPEIHFKTSITCLIPEEVDEWRDYPHFHGYVIPENFTGSLFEFYKTLKPKYEAAIPPNVYSNYDNPFDFLDKNLVFEGEFLKKKLLLNKVFQEYLKGVEEVMNNRNSYEAYCQKYESLINGSFAIRDIREGNNLSNHALAMAIDIDPNHNVDIRPSQGDKMRAKEIFKVIEHITGLEMYGQTPLAGQMKASNQLFKSIVDEDYLQLLINQGSFSLTEIDSLYNLIKYEGDLNYRLDEVRNKILETGTKYFELIPASNDTERELEEKYIETINECLLLVDHIELEINQIEKIVEGLQPQTILYQRFMNDIIYLSEYVDLFDQEFRPEILASLVTEVASISIKQKANEIAELEREFDLELNNYHIEISNIVKRRKNYFLQLAETGFFEMELDLVDSFLIYSEAFRWGGNFKYQKDWMHFELHPATKYLK